MNTVTTTAAAQFNRTTIPSRPLTPKLSFRNRELLRLLQAAGPQWTVEAKCARVTLQFEAGFDQIRAAGIPVQRLTQVNGIRLYRIGPKPWLRSPPPAARPVKEEIRPSVRPGIFVLSPMRPKPLRGTA